MAYLLQKLYIIYCIIRKEFQVTIKDPRSRRVIIIPVIIQGFLFGYTATFNLNVAPYALLDQSHSYYSQQLVNHVEGSQIFQRVMTLHSTNQISEAIDSGEAMAVLVIEPNFANHIASGVPGQIQIITDGRNPVTAGLISSYITSIANSYSQSYMHMTGGVTPVTRIWYNPNLITRWMFLPSLIIMMALTQVIVLSGLSVARERENGTFDQLLVTPLQPVEILIGKAIPPMIIGIIQATIMLLIITWYFRIPMVGSLFDVYLCVIIFLLSCIGIGLTISAFAKNMQQVMVYVFTCMLPMVLLSGITTPVSTMPTILQYVTYINPMRFGVEAIRRIYLEGAGFWLVMPNYIPLLIISCITLPLAAYFFRSRLS